MAKEWARRFYASTQWLECRKSFIAYRITVDGGECQHCATPKKIGYIADHIVELTPENITDPSTALNHENLQWLCLNCHTAKTFKIGKTTREDVMFDSNGDVVETNS